MPMQPKISDIQAGRFGRPPRHDNPTIVLVGQALQTGACICRLANGGDDLRPRWSHRADNGLAEMNANSDSQRLQQVTSQSAVELVHARHISRAPRKASAYLRNALSKAALYAAGVKHYTRKSASHLSIGC
jgi:hypothetical protein